MSGALVAICVWALAVMALAPLPVRRQIPIGTLLLAALPFLLVWLARTHGMWPVVLVLLGAFSLFRKPLRALIRHASKFPAGDRSP